MESALFTFQEKESTIDFEGRLALVFFTRGCNFRCPYCHNPELIPRSKMGNIPYEQLARILDNAVENWIDGVCITGGEPTLQEELSATAAFIKKRGLALKLDTQGSFPENLSRTLPFCDYIAMDYKISLNDYPLLAGVPVNKENIQHSLELIKNSGVDYEIRTTVVPGFHTIKRMQDMAKELEGIKRFVLQAFVPRDNLPDETLRREQKTSKGMLEEYSLLFRKKVNDVVVR